MDCFRPVGWSFDKCSESVHPREILLMAEILHQLIGRLSHYLQGFIHPWWLFGISSINSITMEPMIDPPFRKENSAKNYQIPNLHFSNSLRFHKYTDTKAGTFFKMKVQPFLLGGIYSSVKVEF